MTDGRYHLYLRLLMQLIYNVYIAIIRRCEMVIGGDPDIGLSVGLCDGFVYYPTK